VDQHLDENAVAKRWAMSARTLQRWRQEDKGPAYLKLGGRVVYRLVDIETWEREQRRGGSPGSKTGSGS
jgi:predicted DNA-binding transcriptional regulator AlpA